MNAVALVTFFSMVLVTSPALCMKQPAGGGQGAGAAAGVDAASTPAPLSPSLSPGHRLKSPEPSCCTPRCKRITMFLLALTGLTGYLHQAGHIDLALARFNEAGTGGVTLTDEDRRLAEEFRRNAENHANHAGDQGDDGEQDGDAEAGNNDAGEDAQHEEVNEEVKGPQPACRYVNGTVEVQD